MQSCTVTFGQNPRPRYTHYLVHYSINSWPEWKFTLGLLPQNLEPWDIKHGIFCHFVNEPISPSTIITAEGVLLLYISSLLALVLLVSVSMWHFGSICWTHWQKPVVFYLSLYYSVLDKDGIFSVFIFFTSYYHHYLNFRRHRHFQLLS